jgi:hypothetical protein
VREHEVVVGLPPGLLLEPVERAGYLVGHRHAPGRPLALGRSELAEHPVLADTDALRLPVDVTPAKRHQLALPESRHRGRPIHPLVDHLERAGACGLHQRIDL